MHRSPGDLILYLSGRKFRVVYGKGILFVSTSRSTFIDICQNRIEIKSRNEKMIYAKRLSE